MVMSLPTILISRETVSQAIKYDIMALSICRRLRNGVSTQIGIVSALKLITQKSGSSNMHPHIHQNTALFPLD